MHGVDIQGAVIILDEAHNIVSPCVICHFVYDLTYSMNKHFMLVDMFYL